MLSEGRSVRHRQTWQQRARIAAKLSLVATAAAAALWLLLPRLHDSTIQRSDASTLNASIFILPFRNDGTNQAYEILRSRITDALIDGLALIEGVKVGPRRIGLLHRSEEEARRQALKEFNARHTLAGIVRTSGDQVSITLGFHESAQNRLWLLCFGQCYRRMGRYEHALEALEKARPRWNPPVLLAEIGMVYALMGRRGDALAILQKMDEQAANRYVSPYFKAQIHAALGDKERALDELEKAYEDHCEQLVNVDYSWGLRTDPLWKGMESEPRFVALLKKVGLDVWPR